MNSRPLGRELNHILKDPSNFNAMKQTWVIVILAYSLIPVLCRIENTVKL